MRVTLWIWIAVVSTLNCIQTTAVETPTFANITANLHQTTNNSASGAALIDADSESDTDDLDMTTKVSMNSFQYELLYDENSGVIVLNWSVDDEVHEEYPDAEVNIYAQSGEFTIKNEHDQLNDSSLSMSVENGFQYKYTITIVDGNQLLYQRSGLKAGRMIPLNWYYVMTGIGIFIVVVLVLVLIVCLIRKRRQSHKERASRDVQMDHAYYSIPSIYGTIYENPSTITEYCQSIRNIYLTLLDQPDDVTMDHSAPHQSEPAMGRTYLDMTSQREKMKQIVEGLGLGISVEDVTVDLVSDLEDESGGYEEMARQLPVITKSPSTALD